MPEGEVKNDEAEAIFLGLEEGKLSGCLTLLPENFQDEWHFEYFIKKRLTWGIDFFELRDDLLEFKHLEWAVKYIPEEKRLLSWRKNP